MAQEIFVDLGFNASDDVAFATIRSVFGQLSDGKWENSPRMTGYWLFADVVKKDGKICLKVSTKGWDNSIFEKGVYNPYVNMRSKQIMEKMANFIKAVAKDEYPSGWDRKNTAECDYLSRDNVTVRVCDAYRVYDALKQRKPKVYASVAKNLIKIARALVANEQEKMLNAFETNCPKIFNSKSKMRKGNEFWFNPIYRVNGEQFYGDIEIKFDNSEIIMKAQVGPSGLPGGEYKLKEEKRVKSEFDIVSVLKEFREKQQKEFDNYMKNY